MFHLPWVPWFQPAVLASCLTHVAFHVFACSRERATALERYTAAQHSPGMVATAIASMQVCGCGCRGVGVHLHACMCVCVGVSLVVIPRAICFDTPCNWFIEVCTL